MVVLCQPFLGEDLRDLLFIGIGVYLALIEAAFNVIALGLLGKDHRKAVPVGADRGQRNTACLSGEDEIDLGQIKQLRKLIGDVHHQLAVNPVVEETVNFYDIAGQNLAFFYDPFLELLHNKPPTDM